MPQPSAPSASTKADEIEQNRMEATFAERRTPYPPRTRPQCQRRQLRDPVKKFLQCWVDDHKRAPTRAELPPILETVRDMEGDPTLAGAKVSTFCNNYGQRQRRRRIQLEKLFTNEQGEDLAKRQQGMLQLLLPDFTQATFEDLYLLHIGEPNPSAQMVSAWAQHVGQPVDAVYRYLRLRGAPVALLSSNVAAVIRHPDAHVELQYPPPASSYRAVEIPEPPMGALLPNPGGDFEPEPEHEDRVDTPVQAATQSTYIFDGLPTPTSPVSLVSWASEIGADDGDETETLPSPHIPPPPTQTMPVVTLHPVPRRLRTPPEDFIIYPPIVPSQELDEACHDEKTDAPGDENQASSFSPPTHLGITSPAIGHQPEASYGPIARPMDLPQLHPATSYFHGEVPLVVTQEHSYSHPGSAPPPTPLSKFNFDSARADKVEVVENISVLRRMSIPYSSSSGSAHASPSILKAQWEERKYSNIQFIHHGTQSPI